MIFFTVCTLSHLFQARMLSESLWQSNPGARLIIGLVDRLRPGLDVSPLDRADIVEIETLCIPGFAGMQSRYTIAELCFACKPFFAEHLMRTRTEHDKFVYLDSDIFVFGSFGGLEQALDTYDLVLTPHLCDPADDGGRLERIILEAGAFNAGFFSFRRSAGALAFLRWFSARVEANCYGWAGDQVWLGLAPSLFPNVLVDRNPGMNVAAWNVQNRRLAESDGGVACNAVPLIFYHYSGFDPQHPDRASKVPGLGASMNDRPDLWLALGPILQHLDREKADPLRSLRSPFGRQDKRRKPAPAWIQALRSAVRRSGFDVVRTAG
jgi:hypothetical protein